MNSTFNVIRSGFNDMETVRHLKESHLNTKLPMVKTLAIALAFAVTAIALAALATASIVPVILVPGSLVIVLLTPVLGGVGIYFGLVAMLVGERVIQENSKFFNGLIDAVKKDITDFAKKPVSVRMEELKHLNNVVKKDIRKISVAIKKEVKELNKRSEYETIPDYDPIPSSKPKSIPSSKPKPIPQTKPTPNYGTMNLIKHRTKPKPIPQTKPKPKSIPSSKPKPIPQTKPTPNYGTINLIMHRTKPIPQTKPKPISSNGQWIQYTEIKEWIYSNSYEQK